MTGIVAVGGLGISAHPADYLPLILLVAALGLCIAGYFKFVR
jgi:hypothetical protein